MTVSLSVPDVTRIANEAIQAEQAGFDVVGVTHAEGGGQYAEVILRALGCHEHPCQVSLGVFRDVSESALRAEIARKVRAHVAGHGRGNVDAGLTA
jgi:hypothetical protein